MTFWPKCIQCTFGQDCEKAIGFDEKHAEIISCEYQTVFENVMVKSLTISDIYDYEQISALLGITSKVLLKTFANRRTMIDKIFECIFDIKKFPCFCISIYIVNAKCKVNAKHNNFKEIKKLHSGHHILIFIPLEETITNSLDDNIVKIIHGEQRVTFNFLEKNATVLINYDEIIENIPAFNILSDLLNFAKSKQPIYCLMTIEAKREFLKADIRNAMLTLLSIKKMVYTIRKKFPTETEYQIIKTKILRQENERIKLENEVLAEIAKLQNLLTENKAPLNINTVYYTLHCYMDNCLKEIHDNSESHFNFKLHEKLKQSCRDLSKTPFTKKLNYWILKMDDTNVNEILNFVQKKYLIILNDTTKDYLEQVYSEYKNYCFIFSSEEKTKNYMEPVLQTPDKKLYTIGMSKCKAEPVETPDATNEYLFLSTCDCNSIPDKKVWMCSMCKSFLYQIKEINDWLQCTCGIYETAYIQKQCFFCLEKEEIPKSNDHVEVNETRDSDSDKSFDKIKEINEKDIKVDQTKNIIFVGQTGAGKSTLINSFKNYIMYDFSEACNEYMECCLPVNFQLQTPDFQNVIIKAGPENINENFNDKCHSVTQKPQTYYIKADKHAFNIIDTPGLGDSRGADQDVLNMDFIKEAIVECGSIDAICFVIPSNISKLTTKFEMVMRDLLSLFPKIALKNVFFFFTYASLSSFALGDTRAPLERFIATFTANNNAEIPFGPENVYCVDSEAFMYRLATEQSHKYHHRTEASFKESWEKSRQTIKRFLEKLNTVATINLEDIEMNYELEKCIQEFAKSPKLSIELENIKKLMEKTFSETSMSSFAKRIIFTDEELKSSLKDAIYLCNKLNETNELKRKIQMLLHHYYGISFVNGQSIDTDSNSSTMSVEVKKVLNEICQILAKLRKQSAINVPENVILAVYESMINEEILPILSPSLKLLVNYAKESQNFELKNKIESLLSLIYET